MKKFLGKLGDKVKSIKSLKFARREISKTPIREARTLTVENSQIGQMLRIALFAVIILIFSLELFFAVEIYGFGKNDKYPRVAARIIPYPAVFTASGIVTVSEYLQEKDYIEHFYTSTKQSDVDTEELKSQILRQGAENEIIKKEAITFKINILNSDVDRAMEQIYESNGGQAKVEKALEDLYGLSVNEFKDLIKTQMLRDKISTDVIKQVSVRHILIRVDQNAEQSKVDEAKGKIDGIKKEIDDGLSFSEAANKYSEDVGSNQDGGLLEFFARGDMVEEFEKVAFSSEIGKVSEPFRTSFGWHILVVESTTGYIDKSFDDWTQSLIDNNYVFYLYNK